MDLLVKSCNAAAEFPKNLIYPGAYNHTLEKYVRRLDQDETRLFSRNADAAVDIWQLEDQRKGIVVSGI